MAISFNHLELKREFLKSYHEESPIKELRNFVKKYSLPVKGRSKSELYSRIRDYLSKASKQTRLVDFFKHNKGVEKTKNSKKHAGKAVEKVKKKLDKKRKVKQEFECSMMNVEESLISVFVKEEETFPLVKYELFMEEEIWDEMLKNC